MSDNQQFCLRWNNHQSTLVQVIDSLLSSGVLVDCTLAAEGQYLHAHKVVLCACSPYLETLLSQHYEKHPIVILKDVKFQELKSMMDYMYKGEVNISQDQLGQFLKAAESLQIKGLTDGGGGENDSRDVGSTSQKRHEPAPVRKTIPHNQSRSPVVLPSHTSGLTIEPTKRTLPTHLSESQPDSPIRSREGSTSPTPRKRSRRQRRLSQGEDDGHADNSCDLPMQPQSMSISSVPSSIPPLPSGSSSTITKAPPPDEDSENPESDRLSGLPEGLIKEKIEPQSEMLIEPKTEYMDETNNDDSVEDLTLDDDDDYDGMMEAGAGPSHGGNNPNENYATWQQITGDRQDDAYLNPADTGHRDSQEWACRKCTLFNSIVESSCAACGEHCCNGDNARINQAQGLIQPLNKNLSSHVDQKNVIGTSYADQKIKAGPSYADQKNKAGPSYANQMNIAETSSIDYTNVASPSDSDELNFERVLKLQQINYLELISMELKDIIPNVECFECPICIMDCDPYDGVILRDCLHTFCKNCLIKTIEYSTDVDVKCPFKDDNYSCNSSLQEREIKALVRPEIFQKYLAKAISVAESRIENTFHCKTPNCTGFCIFEDNVNQYCCEVCGKINCLTCQVIHMGLNCRQYQELLVEDSKTNKEAEKTRVMLEKMLQDGNAISCPTCKIIIMKKTGCDFLSCSMCGTGICWVTRGPRWGPKGYGDISGGCKCGLYGRRCHPNCKNCH